MVNNLEDYKPDVSFNEFKVRVLARGHARGEKQACAGEYDDQQQE